MQSRRGWGLITLGAICTMACGTSIQFVPTNEPPGPMAPKKSDDVEVFTTTAPQRGFVEVGMFEGRQSTVYSTDDISEIIAKMREAAAQRGCDALVITASADEVLGSGHPQNQTTSTLRGFRASCAVYTDGAPASQPHRRPPAGAPPAAAASRAEAPGLAHGARVCVPGSTQLCYGPGACKGGQSCLSDGSGYAPCDCGGQPGAAAGDAPPSAGNAPE